MTKTTRVISWTAGIFLLLIVVLIIIIATFDWNRLNRPYNQKVSTELNRPFAIRGDYGCRVGAPERGNRLAKLGAMAARSRRRHHSRQPAGHPRSDHDPPAARGSHAGAVSPVNQNGVSAVDQTSAARRAANSPVQRKTTTGRSISPAAAIKIRYAQPSSWSFRLDNILFDRGRIAIDDKVSKADVEILVDPLVSLCRLAK